MILSSKQKRSLAQKIRWKKQKALATPEARVVITRFLKRKAGSKTTVLLSKVGFVVE